MIRGYLDYKEKPWPAPMVRVALYLPDVPTRWASVDFLIDTGATYSMLGTVGAIMGLGIDPARLRDPAQWPRQMQTFGVGGDVTHYICRAEWSLSHDFSPERPAAARRDAFESDIVVAQPLPGASRPMPSLLGRDIISRYRLVIDEKRRLVALMDEKDGEFPPK